MRLSNAFLLVGVLVASPASTTHAMQQSGILGTVSDSLGNLLEDVQVGLVGTPHYAITDEKGWFKLANVKSGSYTLSMRRLGYQPITMPFAIMAGNAATVDFELLPSTVRLAPVNVKSEHLSAKLRRVGFENRLKTAGVPASHFITRQEIEKRHVTSITQLIDRMGSRARVCDFPSVFLDGAPYATLTDLPPATTAPRSGSAGIGLAGGSSSGIRAPTSADDGAGFRRISPLDMFQVRSIEGIEIYSSTAEIPAEFKGGPNNRLSAKCVVVIWTRDR